MRLVPSESTERDSADKKGSTGDRIRKYRLGKRLSIRTVAEKARLTPGFLSQVEHNRVDPSMDSLRRIAQALETPVFHLLIDDDVGGELVRAPERRRVTFPGGYLTYDIITSRPDRSFGVMAGTLGPGGTSAGELMSHSGEECLLVQTGSVQVEMPHRVYELGEGDSLYFDSSVPHRVKNPGPDPCRYWLIMSPPQF